MKVLITGGAGQLGRAVGEALLGAGHEVVGADSAWRDVPFRLELANLLDVYAVYRLLAGCDAVVHLANHPYVVRNAPAQQTYTENVTLDMNVFQAAMDCGVRNIVFASSVQVVAGRRRGLNDAARPSCLPYLPMDGDLPTQPGNVYALSKQAGEQQLAYLSAGEPGLACTAVRFPWLLDEHHMERFHHQMRGEEERYWGNLDEGFSYLAMPDAASLVCALLERQGPGYRSIQPAGPGNQMDKPPADLIPRFFPNVPLRVPAERMEALVDISPITRMVGWTPRVDLWAPGGA